RSLFALSIILRSTWAGEGSNRTTPGWVPSFVVSRLSGPGHPTDRSSPVASGRPRHNGARNVQARQAQLRRRGGGPPEVPLSLGAPSTCPAARSYSARLKKGQAPLSPAFQ